MTGVATAPLPGPLHRFDAMDAVRLAWGMAGSLLTSQAAEWYGVPPQVPHRGLAVTAVRVLGVRDVLQATALPATGDPRARRLGAAVDALHVVSMLPLALFSRTWRRPALTSAAVTAVFALVELRAGRRPDPTPRSAGVDDETDAGPVLDGTGAEVLPLYTVDLPPSAPDPGHEPVEEVNRELEELGDQLREPFRRKDLDTVRKLAHERARLTTQRTRYILQRSTSGSRRGPRRA